MVWLRRPQPTPRASCAAGSGRTRGRKGNLINAIRFAKDKLHGWAVGADGAILRTDNGGFVWKEQRSTANTTLYGLYVKDKSRAVIAGASGVVLTTVNGGERWIRRPTGVRDHLFSVTFAPDSPLHGWAVGTFGTIVATTDGGLTWKKQESHTAFHLFSVSFINKKVRHSRRRQRHVADHQRRRSEVEPANSNG